MSKLLDQLLKPGIPNLQTSRPTGQYKVLRLSKLAKEPVTVTLHALEYGQVEFIKGLSAEGESDVQIVLSGFSKEDLETLRDESVKAKFGGPTPADTLKGIYLPGEIEDMSRTVQSLTGYRRTTIEEIKNPSPTEQTKT